MTNAKKTALVTGANKGIGFETARQLAQRGFVVWLGCRDEGRGVAAAKELAKDGEVRFVRLDVTDVESVRAAAGRIEKETGALDVLVQLPRGEYPARTWPGRWRCGFWVG
jgi:NAD(P)-dependent dehydrogenase (short-subunit alcohol dehydrogenase family)